MIHIGRRLSALTGLLIGLTISACNPALAALPDDLAGKRFSVTASVQHGPGAFIRAEQVPGPFTVPKGYRATSFKYHFGDPQTNYETDQLRAGNIRVIRGGYIGPDVGTSEFSLHEGDYVFVVGGLPGAMGTLSYTLVRSEDADDRSAAGERIIDVVGWSTQYPEYKAKATYFVRDGKVSGEMKHTYEYPKNEYWTSESVRITGTFSGAMAGNVITGNWQQTTHPHRMNWFGGDSYPAYDRVDSGKTTHQSRIVLYADGTLSETLKGTGTTELNWGPTAPKDVAGKREVLDFQYAVPGEAHSQPLTGTWKNRE